VLISGHHANIDKWRDEMSLAETEKKRPDLLGAEKGESNA
jgi:tRNA (guanine37-N1)-methyltransferase